MEDSVSTMNKAKNSFLGEYNGSVIYGGKKGIMYKPSNDNYPYKKFIKAGDEMRMKLDLKALTLSMSINDKDYGVIPDFKPKSKTNYRFAVSVYGKECELEFF